MRVCEREREMQNGKMSTICCTLSYNIRDKSFEGLRR